MNGKKNTIAVRLEGGIGDHILGLRLLYFIRKRYPGYRIIAYSDASGGLSQLEIARMSPFLSGVVPVFQKKMNRKEVTWGSLDNIQKKYRDKMHSAELFFDTWQSFFTEESRILNVPFYEILRRRPELVVPAKAKKEIAGILKPFRKNILAGLNIADYHPNFFTPENKNNILRLIRSLLKDERVVIFNFYASNFSVPHWPKAWAAYREQRYAQTSLKLGRLWNISPRVVPAIDYPITQVAALLRKCKYFIGVDNGIKHLAWALGIPHTFFYTPYPKLDFILRWMPDFHRGVLFNCGVEELSEHILKAKECLS